MSESQSSSEYQEADQKSDEHEEAEFESNKEEQDNDAPSSGQEESQQSDHEMPDDFVKNIRKQNGSGTPKSNGKMTNKKKEMLLKFMSESQLQKLMARDSEDLKQVLNEFYKSIEVIQTKLKPVVDKINKTKEFMKGGQKNKKEIIDGFEPIVTEHGMSYLEMKYNLMLSYIQFLSLYLLMKLDAADGANLSKHPIVQRLLHIKLLFERLRPLDSKLQYQIDKQVRTATLVEAQQQQQQSNTQDAPDSKKKSSAAAAYTQVLAQTDALAHKVDVGALMEDLGGNGADAVGDDDDGSGDDDDGSGVDDDDMSDIEDDLDKNKNKDKKKKKNKRINKDSDDAADDSDDEEEEKSRPVKVHQKYKAPKITPMLFQDKSDRETKRKAREEKHEVNRLTKSNYYQMIEEDLDDRPAEVHALGGMRKKSQYFKEMDMLEQVEGMCFQRKTMNKEEKKLHKRKLKESQQEGLDQLDDFKQIADIVEKKYQRQQNENDYDASSQPQISSKFKKSMSKMLKNSPGPGRNGQIKNNKRDQKTKSKYSNRR